MVSSEISVQTLNHLGIIAGIIDEIGLVEQIDQRLGRHPKEIVSAGQVVKAMILNGLGFVSAPLYLFGKFFEGKATEHLIGAGVRAEHLNDDRLGRVLDQLYLSGLTQLFVSIALKAAKQLGVATDRVHLDSSSFHVHGEYEPMSPELRVVRKTVSSTEEESDNQATPKPIHITYGYSRDHRPDLKQFIIDLICSGDGDVPLYLRVTDGNEADKAMFAQLILEFRQQLNWEAWIVADSALYTADNLKSLQGVRWISRVPLTIAEAKRLVDELSADEFVATQLVGYRIAERSSQYAGVEQIWVIVESEVRKQADIKQLHSSLEKLEQRLNQQLVQLCLTDFRCEADALLAADRFANKLKFHALQAVTVIKYTHHAKPGRPRKDAQPNCVNYRLQATLVRNQSAVQKASACSGRFVLAANRIDSAQLSAEQVLQQYKEQQSPERGFRFLKDPLFFTASVCLKSPERVAALAFVMGLCLLIYSLGQRQLRHALVEAGDSINNQLGKATQRPTLRWVFQCFQDVHLLHLDELKQVVNLTTERLHILRFFGTPCRQYYLLL
jgi:transposase